MQHPWRWTKKAELFASKCSIEQRGGFYKFNDCRLLYSEL